MNIGKAPLFLACPFVLFCGHSIIKLSHLLPNFFQISCIDYFHQTLAKVQIWILSDER